MRVLIIGTILILNTMLQSTYWQYIRIRGVTPNLSIIIIVSFALLRGSMEGAMIGFFVGLLYDIFYGGVIGFHAMLGMYVGYLCGKPNQNFFRENYLLPFLLVIFSTFAYEIIVYVTNFLIRGKIDFAYFFNRVILPEVVYTAIPTMLVYKLIYIINEKIERREQHNRKFFR